MNKRKKGRLLRKLRRLAKGKIVNLGIFIKESKIIVAKIEKYNKQLSK